jgi:hypothetical protein
VNGAAETTGLRDAAQGAFDRAAADSNLALSFTTSTTSYEVSRALLDKLVTASRTDPEWPDGLALTGDWSPEQGKFILSAGDRSSDPAALTYFERRWPGLIFLSPQTPATPQ